MTKKDSGYYLVKEDILPSAIKKTIKVKEMLRRHDNMTINDAVSKMGLAVVLIINIKTLFYHFMKQVSIKLFLFLLFLIINREYFLMC